MPDITTDVRNAFFCASLPPSFQFSPKFPERRLKSSYFSWGGKLKTRKSPFFQTEKTDSWIHIACLTQGLCTQYIEPTSLGLPNPLNHILHKNPNKPPNETYLSMQPLCFSSELSGLCEATNQISC